jgi:hypothetical protein
MKKYKLGKDQKSGQEHARIWLENKRLSEIGFTPNSYYATEWIPGVEGEGQLRINGVLSDGWHTTPPTLKLWLLGDDDVAAEVHKVTDKKGTSVIDLSGWVIKQFFEGYTHCTVEYEDGCITIKGANE